MRCLRRTNSIKAPRIAAGLTYPLGDGVHGISKSQSKPVVPPGMPRGSSGCCMDGWSSTGGGMRGRQLELRSCWN